METQLQKSHGGEAKPQPLLLHPHMEPVGTTRILIHTCIVLWYSARETRVLFLGTKRLFQDTFLFQQVFLSEGTSLFRCAFLLPIYVTNTFLKLAFKNKHNFLLVENL